MGGVGIRIDGISKQFSHRVKGLVYAVRDVSLAVEPGELLTLLGPSGCGKTTTLRMIAGFERPDTGRVLIGDQDVTGLMANERNIGFVFQNYALFPHLTVFENVAYGLRVKKMLGSEIGTAVHDVLALVGLTGYDRQYPHQLSGGEQQRVALARAIVIRPRVLLFDEPLSNLDAKLRVHMRREIQQLQKQLSITAVYVTHDQEEALTLSDRIAVLDHGKVQQLGSPRDLYQRPENPFVADFIGINNLLAGEVKGVEEGAGRMVVQTRFGLFTCAIGVRFRAGDACKVTVRPEVASICSSGEPGDGMNLIAGTVSFASYIGNTIRYDIELGPETVFKVDVQNPWNQQTFPIGQKVHVRFPVQMTLGIPA